MIYKWDIILVPFPFTDLSTNKKRPALVISPNQYNKSWEVVIAFITSNLSSKPRMGDYKIRAWQKAGLPKPSLIRMRFATIDKSIIIKKIGELTEIDIEFVQPKLIDFFSKS